MSHFQMFSIPQTKCQIGYFEGEIHCLRATSSLPAKGSTERTERAVTQSHHARRVTAGRKRWAATAAAAGRAAVRRRETCAGGRRRQPKPMQKKCLRRPRRCCNKDRTGGFVDAVRRAVPGGGRATTISRQCMILAYIPCKSRPVAPGNACIVKVGDENINPKNVQQKFRQYIFAM